MNEMPSARSLAIRVCNVGSGAVEGSPSRQASKGGHSRPHGDLFANPRAVSHRVAGGAVITLQSAVQQPQPIRRRMGMLQQNLARLAGARRAGHPPQHIVQAASVRAAAWKNAWITFAASAA
jgi:hypothetical protein